MLSSTLGAPVSLVCLSADYLSLLSLSLSLSLSPLSHYRSSLPGVVTLLTNAESTLYHLPGLCCDKPQDSTATIWHIGRTPECRSGRDRDQQVLLGIVDLV